MRRLRSSVRRVTQLSLQAAEEHGLVLKKPGPVVALSEFVDKGLLFTLSYWINMGEANPSQVASDLRRMIMHQLTENGIALSNMPIQLVAPTRESSKTPAGSDGHPDKIGEK